MAGTSAVVKESVMLPDIEQDCIDCAAFALTREELSEQRSVAQFIKKELDGKYGRQWHVIVGLFFGSYVSHDAKEYVYFHIDDLAFLIWRTEWSGKEVAIPTYPVRGRIISSLTRDHVFGARIECGSASVTSGPSGSFELPLIYGQATIQISAKGFCDLSRAVNVERGGSVDLGDLVLTSELIRRTGDVVDVVANTPLAGVSLTIAASDVRTTKTNATGGFTFDSAPGAYEVVFSKRGYFKKATRVEIAAPAEGAWTSESLGSVQLAPFPQCAAIADLAGTAPKRHYTALIDRSESMNNDGRWDDMRETLQTLATAVVAAGAKLDVVLFSTGIKPKLGCKSVAEAMGHFDGQVPDGATDLAAGLSSAFSTFHERGSEPTSVVVFTDGVPDSVPDALAMLQNAASAASSASTADALHVSFVGVGSENHLEQFLAQVEESPSAANAAVVDVVREAQCGGERPSGLLRALLNV